MTLALPNDIAADVNQQRSQQAIVAQLRLQIASGIHQPLAVGA